jgi:protein-S-isoprenylcysteine O-methyltransferase Ste14
MDTARYVLAVICLVGFPPAIIYWLILHPFIDFWRSVGRSATYVVLAIVFIGVGVAAYLVRDPLLAVDYGTNRWLWIPAAACYGVTVWIQMRIRKQLTFRVLAGAPELEKGGKGGTLLAEGLYARMRHPRYTGVILGVSAFALFTNYLAVYLLIPISALGLALIVRLEERELAERFGEEYARYRARVPMFFPRLRGESERTA